MHSSIITKCLDQNMKVVLYHLSRQSCRFKSNSCMKKRRSPLLTLKNDFTYILDSILEKQIAFGASYEFQNFMQEHAVGSKPAIKTIMKLLQIDEKNATDIIEHNEGFGYVTCKTITDNYRMLKTAGMSLSNLQNNPVLLSYDNNDLKKKIKIVQKLVDDINCGVSLLLHSVNSLDLYINSISQFSDDSDNSVRNKIKFYKEHWNVENEDLCNLLAKYLYYLTKYPQKSESIIKLLLDNKVTVKSLLNKKWLLMKDIEKIKKRFEICSEFGFASQIEPWILRYNDILFNRNIQIHDSKQESSKQYSQIIKLLSQNSGYSTTLIKYRFSIYCHFQNLNFKEAKVICNIIVNEGYEWHDLVWYIKVLDLPKEVILERFSELKKINYKSTSLEFLLLSNQNFVNYVNNCKNKY